MEVNKTTMVYVVRPEFMGSNVRFLPPGPIDLI